MTTVALYDTLGAESVQFVVNQTALTTIACAGSYVQSLVNMKRANQVPTLQNLVVFDPIDGETLAEARSIGLNLYEFSQVVALGRQQAEQELPPEPVATSVYMFCYTSGTTGEAKAAMITHENILSVASSANFAGI